MLELELGARNMLGEIPAMQEGAREVSVALVGKVYVCVWGWGAMGFFFSVVVWLVWVLSLFVVLAPSLYTILDLNPQRSPASAS